MRITRTGTYVMTAVSVALFVFLSWAFDSAERFSLSGPWFSQVGERGDLSWFDGVFYTYLFIALIIAGGVYMASRIPEDGVEVHPAADTSTPGQIQDPSWWRLLLGNAYLSVLWLPLRFYIGREWLVAGEHKVRADAWTNGDAIQGYWTRVIENEDAAYVWYENFLQYMVDHGWSDWFGPAIAYGEVLVGLGLIVGALVGIAAFFGTLMNVSFMLAGSVSSNPVMFGLTIFVILAWKVAGWLGLDRYILPALGTPWYRGDMLGGEHKTMEHSDLVGGHKGFA